MDYISYKYKNFEDPNFFPGHNNKSPCDNHFLWAAVFSRNLKLSGHKAVRQFQALKPKLIWFNKNDYAFRGIYNDSFVKINGFK
jgi:hypothetical protein